MPARIVPVLHVADGRLVHPDGSHRPEAAVSTAHRLAKQFGSVYLVDVQGLARNRPDVALLQEIARKASVWADTGARFTSDGMDAFIAGSERVVLRWRLLAERRAATELVALADPGTILLALEFDEGGFMTNPDNAAGLDEALAFAGQEGMGLVAIDRTRAGTLGGARREVMGQVHRFKGERWFAGGVASASDLEAIETQGFTGALVSTAVLEGRLP